jgi:hypothetical protein
MCPLFFNAFGIGDRLDIKYNGQYIIGTCPYQLKPWHFPKCNAPAECFIITMNGNLSYFKEFSFDYDPQKSKTMDVFVTGYCSDRQTTWKLNVECP